MKMHAGIVLKHYVPQRNMCALMDSSLGRITVVLTHDLLSAGSILQYRLVKKRDWYYADQIELIHVPLLLARSEMLFLHYLLEMCYHFVLEGDQAVQVYNVLLFVCNLEEISREEKQRILCIFLALLELYPEDDRYAGAQLYALAQLPLEQVFKEKVDIKIEKNIAGWLYQSIREHVGAGQFKTIHFLDEIR